MGDGRAEQAAGDHGGADRLMQPVAGHEGQRPANRGGALFDRGGHGVIRSRARTGSVGLTRDGKGRAQASLKNVSNVLASLEDLEAWKIFGRSGRQARSMLTKTVLKGP